MDTLRDKQPARGALGLGRGAVEDVGVSDCGSRTSAVVLARPPRARHRAHRLQGQLARACGCSGSAPRSTGFSAASRPTPSLFELARRRRRDGVRVEGDVRDAEALPRAFADAPARGRVPPGRAVAGAALVRGSGRDLRDQRDGHGQRARGRARQPTTCRARGQRDHDKCYENREWDVGLSRGRAAGRPRSVLQQQGLRRARHGAYRASFFGD